MNVEIADRLTKLRKKNGYSQEELADKLGLSRQAVSKWERAEASPDTDNLICLAKLYGVSLDELLSTDEDVDTIVKEQVNKEDNKEGIHIEDDEGNKVHIDSEGVHLEDDKGNTVSFDKGVHIFDPNGKPKKIDKGSAIIALVECSLTILAVVSYILLGTLAHMWHNGWVVFFIPGIIGSICRVIYKKNLNKLNMAFIACFVFFFVCMVAPGLEAGLWHPMWVVFLAIPLYHSIIGTIHKINNKSDEDD